MYLLLLIGLSGCEEKLPLETVENVNLERYQGTWYEIARIPNQFEKDLIKVTANYTIKDNGRIRVLNQGYNTKKGKNEKAIGEAKVVGPGKLKVTFFKPFYGDYYIMELDKDYQYVLVGSPSRDYLWILSRTPQISDELYNELSKIASDANFDINRLVKVGQ